MADIAAIADGELNSSIRAKLNTAIGRTNTGTFAEATIGGATAGTSCLLSGFDMHGEIDSFGSAQEYIK